MGKSQRKSEETRQSLIDSAYREFQSSGYLGASLDRIIVAAGVTKGALYHHFKSKAELSAVVIEEVLGPLTQTDWVKPLSQSADPIDRLGRLLREYAETHAETIAENGSPLVAFTVGAATLGSEAQRLLKSVFDNWVSGLADALSQGQASGSVREAVDPYRTAQFIVSSILGAEALTAGCGEAATLSRQLELLAGFIGELRKATS